MAETKDKTREIRPLNYVQVLKQRWAKCPEVLSLDEAKIKLEEATSAIINLVELAIENKTTAYNLINFMDNNGPKDSYSRRIAQDLEKIFNQA